MGGRSATNRVDEVKGGGRNRRFFRGGNHKRNLGVSSAEIRNSEIDDWRGVSGHG